MLRWNWASCCCRSCLCSWLLRWSVWLGRWRPVSWGPCACRWQSQHFITAHLFSSTHWRICAFPTTLNPSQTTSSPSGSRTSTASSGESLMLYEGWKCHELVLTERVVVSRAASTTGRCASSGFVLSLTLSTGLRLLTRWPASFFQQPFFCSMAWRGRTPAEQNTTMTKMMTTKTGKRRTIMVGNECYYSNILKIRGIKSYEYVFLLSKS